MIRLAIDLPGADTPEETLCRGALRALQNNSDLFLYLFGHADRLFPVLNEFSDVRDRAELTDCSDVLTNYDDSMTSYTRADASLVKAMQFTKAQDDVSGLITCGPTGAVFVCSVMILKKLQGVRPVLAVELKDAKGSPFLLLDCGANIDSRPELYVSFAHLGNAYMRSIGCTLPRIALLSNGSEDTKGCEAVKEANALLKYEALNFIGNLEATDALCGKADVIVCDGFHGNILLKSIEGTAKAVLAELASKTQDARTQLLLAEVRRKYDYNTQGGAVLLGVEKLVMKGHGSATGEAVEHMIERACLLSRNCLLQKVRETYPHAEAIYA